MPDIVYGDAGTNRTITGITYGDAGTNRTLVQVWYGDAGTNRLVWPNVAVSLTNKSIYSSRIGAGLVRSTFNLQNTGVASGVVNPAGTGGGSYAPQWLSGGTPANYDARWTIVSGVPTTGTTGIYQNLGTTRTWTLDAPGGFGTVTAIGTVEIRDAATLIVLATATIQLDAERA